MPAHRSALFAHPFRIYAIRHCGHHQPLARLAFCKGLQLVQTPSQEQKSRQESHSFGDGRTPVRRKSFVYCTAGYPGAAQHEPISIRKN